MSAALPPRTAASMAEPRISAIIASASPSRSGSMRSAKSRVTSMATPPMPNASDSPKSGSRDTPANTSTPPLTNSWTR